MRQKILNEAYFVGLLRAEKRQRRVLLKTITDKQMKALIEIVYNILQGYGSLTDKDKMYLKKYQSVIRRFTDKRVSSKQRKRLLEKYVHIFARLLKAIQKNITVQWREN